MRNKESINSYLQFYPDKLYRAIYEMGLYDALRNDVFRSMRVYNRFDSQRSPMWALFITA